MTPDIQGVSGPTLPIEGPQTIADVERKMSEIESQRPAKLVVPVKLKKWWFGGEASLIQLLITWGRSRPDATLVTHIGEGEDPANQLGRLVSRPFGLVAVWMARDVTDRKGDRALKVLANRASETEIDLMWFGRQRQQESRQPSLWGGTDEVGSPEVTSVGDRVFLASIDHHPRWRIPQCYFPTGEVRHRDDFVALADSMAKKATRGRGGSPITAEVRGPLGGILHELFKNTHEWARTDETGVPLLRSVRGMLAQGHTWAEQEAMEATAGSPVLAAYLSAPGIRTPEGRWRFLELSVFDSGPGLARWRASRPKGGTDPVNPTLEDEYRACMECFLRWNSSTRAGHKGLGLHEVMETLSLLGAFFRVRTGRLSLYRDFVARPYAGSVPERVCFLADWSSMSDSLTPLAAVEGVLYTMLIPIRGRPI